ncbi:MAG TPA: hypothetical protein VMF06_15920 [Candidatus Limnocylindria bacterium]|jgi:hypothetical protein|nr:hypothetical protein [Candidatus Limnocylindria bacterium]
MAEKNQVNIGVGLTGNAAVVKGVEEITQAIGGEQGLQGAAAKAAENLAETGKQLDQVKDKAPKLGDVGNRMAAISDATEKVRRSFLALNAVTIRGDEGGINNLFDRIRQFTEAMDNLHGDAAKKAKAATPSGGLNAEATAAAATAVAAQKTVQATAASVGQVASEATAVAAAATTATAGMAAGATAATGAFAALRTGIAAVAGPVGVTVAAVGTIWAAVKLVSDAVGNLPQRVNEARAKVDAIIKAVQERTATMGTPDLAKTRADIQQQLDAVDAVLKAWSDKVRAMGRNVRPGIEMLENMRLAAELRKELVKFGGELPFKGDVEAIQKEIKALEDLAKTVTKTMQTVKEFHYGPGISGRSGNVQREVEAPRGLTDQEQAHLEVLRAQLALAGTQGSATRIASSNDVTSEYIDSQRALGIAKSRAILDEEKSRIAAEEALNEGAYSNEVIKLQAYLERRRQLVMDGYQADLRFLNASEFASKTKLIAAQTPADKMGVETELVGIISARKQTERKLQQDLQAIKDQAAHDQLVKAKETAALEAEERFRATKDAIEKIVTDADIKKAQIGASFVLTDEDKRFETLNVLKQEAAEMAAALKQLEQAKANLKPDDREGALRVDTEISQLRQRGRSIGAERATLEGQPGISSYRDQFQAAFTAIKNDWGSWPKQAAQGFLTLMQATERGLSNSFQGLLNGTMTIGQAVRSLWVGLGQSIAQVISDMVAKWIVSHVVMKSVTVAWHALTTALGWASAGAHAAQEGLKTTATVAGGAARTTAVVAESGTQTAVTMTAAGTQATATGIAGAFRSIMELGPVAGPIVFGAGIAALIALVYSITKGFAKGGYTPGQTTLATVGEEGTEFVIPAGPTARFGPRVLEQLRQGRLPTVPVATPAAAQGGSGDSRPINVHAPIFFDPRELGRYLQDHIDERIKHTNARMGLRTT